MARQIFPRPRMQHYYANFAYRRDRAARAIQAALHAWYGRVGLLDAVQRVQRAFRGRDRRAGELFQRARRRAATCIQACWRGRRTRMVLGGLFLALLGAALALQAAARGFLARARAHCLRLSASAATLPLESLNTQHPPAQRTLERPAAVTEGVRPDADTQRTARAKRGSRKHGARAARQRVAQQAERRAAAEEEDLGVVAADVVEAFHAALADPAAHAAAILDRMAAVRARVWLVMAVGLQAVARGFLARVRVRRMRDSAVVLVPGANTRAPPPALA